MDETENSKREVNPREKASLLSKVTFAFSCPLFAKGLRKDLKEEDIYEPVNNCRATKLGNKLERSWKEESLKKSPSVLWAIFRTFGWEYFTIGILLFFVNTFLILSKPLLKGKIVSYFTPNQTALSFTVALWYVAALIGISFFDTFFSHSYVFVVEQLTLKIKVAVSALVYRKALRLSPAYLSKIASGQAVTIISKDVNLLDLTVFLGNRLWIGFIQIFIMAYIMYRQIGVSALVGTGALFFFIPLQAFLGKKAAHYRSETARHADERVMITQEIITAIRIIKMYTWEYFFDKSVFELRKKEIHNLRILFYIRAIILSTGHLNSRFALYVCVITYVALGNHITAEKAFVVTGCFMTLRVIITIFMPLGISFFSELSAVMGRITKFLLLEEVEQSSNVSTLSDKEEPNVYIKSATVKSDNDIEILEDVNLTIKPGLTVITGAVGSGKSTLLKLILGDVKKLEGEVEVFGKMSYASQEPWLFPGSVRQNITFGEPFDQQRYDAIVKACALRKDLEELPEGERTVLTDKGLNLSRGQKTRVNLARAVYKAAHIYLLDDCLSAVDPHVAKQIFQECVKGFLRDKICVLVTHQEHLLKEANNIVILGKGCVRFQGTYENLKEWNTEDFKSVVAKNADLDYATKAEDEKLSNEIYDADETTNLLVKSSEFNKNIYKENKEEGAVNMEVYKKYFMSGGGIKMIILVMVLSIAAQAISSWSDYFVSFWVDMEQELSEFRFNGTTNTTAYKTLEDSHDTVMKQYSLVILGAAIFTILKSLVFFTFSCNASKNIHNEVINKIINARMVFFDENLSGNIINRLSRDLSIIDESMSFTLNEIIRMALLLLGILFMVSSVNPWFLIPSVVFIVILYFARRLYMPTGRGIRRLEGATRSPVIGQFNATLDGLTTIRASEAQPILSREFDKHLDLYNSAVYMHLMTTRAFGFFLDVMCDFYVTLITLSFFAFDTHVLAGKVGLAITQAFSLTGLLQWAVRQWADLENHMTSTERVLEYRNIEPEDKSGDKINNWPHSGTIVYEDVNLRYAPTSERVLKNVNFTILSKQKVGIVGRTGAGKTSIISTLFRLYDYKGTISIDGINTSSLAVELLRSKLSIIPQDPVLFTGTIRSNLDPNNEYSDRDLWDALIEVEMKDSIETLEHPIREGGSNFSIGQRQLICLARAIVKNNIILVLDEATANIDPQTDALIQKTIRKTFSHCTVIMIAHRLNTILDADRIIVMDSGTVIEFDHPNVLLANPNSAFFKMVNEAGL